MDKSVSKSPGGARLFETDAKPRAISSKLDCCSRLGVSCTLLRITMPMPFVCLPDNVISG